MTSNPYNGFSAELRGEVGRMVYGAFRSGLVARPSRCELCTATRNVQAHNEDYDEPWAYREICQRCHMALHVRFHNPGRWARLLEQIDLDAGQVLFGARPAPAWARLLPMERIDLRQLRALVAAGSAPDWAPPYVAMLDEHAAEVVPRRCPD